MGNPLPPWVIENIGPPPARPSARIGYFPSKEMRENCQSVNSPLPFPLLPHRLRKYVLYPLNNLESAVEEENISKRKSEEKEFNKTVQSFQMK